jgi:hypothetical protein
MTAWPRALTRPRLASLVLRRRPAAAVAVVALAVCLAHLPYLGQAPDDLDSINFALGLRSFDVTRNQPHPPGAPVYIGLGKASVAAAEWLGLEPHPLAGIEPIALTLVAAISGGVLTIALWGLFGAMSAGLRDPRHVPWIAAALAIACPLTWLLAARPMSDVPGLAAATLAQALLLRSGRRTLVLGAAIAGVAAGIRIQAAMLTVPLLAIRLWREQRDDERRAIVQPAAACAIVILAWSAIVAFHGGGPAAYAQTLVQQAREDLSSSALVWWAPSVPHTARALAYAAAFPWGSAPFAVLVLGLAVAGVAVMVISRAWRELGTIALLWGPYAVFHFGVHDPATVRYALPFVPPVAYAAARALSSLPRRGAAIAATAVLALTLASSVRALDTSSAAGSPLFRLAADMGERARSMTTPPLVLSHLAPGIALRRVEELLPERAPWRWIRPKRDREWLQIAKAWRSGTVDRLWFVASARRADLALVDPRSLRLLREYRQPPEARWLLSGLRPAALNWYEIRRPNWIALEGWALTPETAGIATRDGKGPHLAPIAALVRPLDRPAIIVVGGRHVGPPGSAAARVTVELAGREIDRFEANAIDRTFLRTIVVPPAHPARDYAQLTIGSTTTDGAVVPVAIEQFDYQPADTVVFAYGDGWHEMELNPRTGLRWRWTAANADLRIHAPGDVRVSLTGESPRRYFRRPARLIVRAGDTVLAERDLLGDYHEDVCVPGGLLQATHGRLTVATDRTFVPRKRSGSPDARELGLRVFAVDVSPADCEFDATATHFGLRISDAHRLQR